MVWIWTGVTVTPILVILFAIFWTRFNITDDKRWNKAHDYLMSHEDDIPRPRVFGNITGNREAVVRVFED